MCVAKTPEMYHQIIKLKSRQKIKREIPQDYVIEQQWKFSFFIIIFFLVKIGFRPLLTEEHR